MTFLVCLLEPRNNPYLIGSIVDGKIGYKTYTLCEIGVQGPSHGSPEQVANLMVKDGNRRLGGDVLGF